jgi:hypothetical protein
MTKWRWYSGAVGFVEAARRLGESVFAIVST